MEIYTVLRLGMPLETKLLIHNPTKLKSEQINPPFDTIDSKTFMNHLKETQKMITPELIALVLIGMVSAMQWF